MRRYLLPPLALLSLLLCIACALLWLRSNQIQDCISVTRGPASWEVLSMKGRIRFSPCEEWDSTPGYAEKILDRQMEYRYRSGERLLGDFDGTIEDGATLNGYEGFGFLVCMRGIPNRASMSTSRLYIVPMWFVIVVTAILPSGWCISRLARFGARMLRRTHNCAICGYDLRASPIRCPECGTKSPTVST